MDTHTLQHIDPLQKQPTDGVNGEQLSPMDPPAAYAPPARHSVPAEAMHPFLRQLIDEHTAFMEELKQFDEAILSVQQQGFTPEADRKLRHFFHYFNADVLAHHRREERILFPLLHERLIADGEHGTGTMPTTPVDIMEDDHVKAMQLAAVVLNFLGLAFRLPDAASRLIVLDTALEQGKTLAELMRLHIFREDQVVFASAHRLISTAEFDAMQAHAAAGK